MKEKNKSIEELVKVFSAINDRKEMDRFLRDLCSEAELIAISERLSVAKRLKGGEMYSDIAGSMDVSSSLIAKVDDVMKSGKGGFSTGIRALESDSVCYGTFASMYDSLTYDVDYKGRVDYIEKLFERFSDIPVHSVLDLACGTGTASVMLSDRGYEVIGVDSSEEMLAEARRKQGERDILFLQQSMSGFELYGTVDAVVCLLDSVNYVVDARELQKCFELVNNYLNPGGLFIFDINTKYKLENILAGNVFVDEYDNVFYTWENYYDNNEKICEFDLNFFMKDGDNTYRRFNETHYERAYTDREIKTVLEKANLKLVAMYDDMSYEEPNKKSEKVFYIGKKL
ncbi:MAG: methyltransferase domain-containing protein [Bacillota bacterium]|nr:methyltransferase domain-containing protein [Bacillota bacterium]